MRRGDGSARGTSPRPLAAAFDELRFGRENTLDLRSSLPTGADAARRAEAFLRARQMASAREVLVITGRGNQSAGGVPVVRPSVVGVLARLRRAGVVEGWQEHTPGSFVVKPAPVSALFEAPRRHGDAVVENNPEEAALAGLDASTRRVLRHLAERSLESLGAPVDELFVHDEMQRQYAALCQSLHSGADRELQLRSAAARALDELDAAE